MASKFSSISILVAPLLLLLFNVFPFFADARGRGNSFIDDTIVIDGSGSSTIQAAINSVPMNNKKWVTIFVKAGVHNEQVKIPAGKEFVHLKGEGMGRTVVTWDVHGTKEFSATFECLANNVLVTGISFVNSYNYPPNKNPTMPALAAKISGDKVAFSECRFSGYQDTLLDDAGRHYFKKCTIEGAVDFICGGAQSIYEQCTISVSPVIGDPGLAGFIAAHARDHVEDAGGFVFKKCTITGKGKVLLGRAWKSHSRVIYYQSYLSDIVVPAGWDPWYQKDHVELLTFAEEECTGPGSNKAKRVPWEKKLSQNEVQQFTSMSYIDGPERWTEKLPEPIRD